MKIEIQSIETLAQVVEKIITQAAALNCWVFYGEIGAGKTTLIKEIGRHFQVKETITSPTFSLINQYESAQGYIYHLDLYRLKSIEEAIDIGIEDLLYGSDYCWIEWPQLIEPLLPQEYLKIDISLTDKGTRIFHVVQVKNN